MESRSFHPFRDYLPSFLTLLVLGWGGVALVVTLTLPTVWPRWLFFACFFLALTGTALPAVWFLNLRFPSDPPPSATAIVREAIWVGTFGTVLAWLQLGRVASWWLFLGLLVGLTAIEYLIRLREKSRWRPALPPEPEKPPRDESPSQPSKPPSDPVG